MSLIQRGLLIGDYRDAMDMSLLRKHGVSHIVCSAGELKPVYPQRFNYKHVMADDMPKYDLGRHFDHTADFIHDAIRNGGTVLVHCAAGVSRSVSLALAYLIKHGGMRLSTAYGLVKNRRPRANPNPGFINQLKHFESRIHDSSKTIPRSSSHNQSKYEESPKKFQRTPLTGLSRNISPNAIHPYRSSEPSYQYRPVIRPSEEFESKLRSSYLGSFGINDSKLRPRLSTVDHEQRIGHPTTHSSLRDEIYSRHVKDRPYVHPSDILTRSTVLDSYKSRIADEPVRHSEAYNKYMRESVSRGAGLSSKYARETRVPSKIPSSTRYQDNFRPQSASGYRYSSSSGMFSGSNHGTLGYSGHNGDYDRKISSDYYTPTSGTGGSGARFSIYNTPSTSALHSRPTPGYLTRPQSGYF